MPLIRLRTTLVVALVLGASIVGLGMALSRDQTGERETMVVLKQGTSDSGARWELRHRVAAGQDCLELAVDGGEPYLACDFDIPDRTEVGFGGGLKPGEGDFFLYGLTTSRVATIVADSPRRQSEVQTEALPSDTTRRFFILIREPVDDVDALEALDSEGKLVQRLELPRE